MHARPDLLPRPSRRPHLRPPRAAVLLLALALLGCSDDVGRRRSSTLVAAVDGTGLAVDAWLPAAAGPSSPVTAVLRPTTGWRDFEMRSRPFLDRPIGWEVDRWNAAGMALVVFDARGTGASFGQRGDPWGLTHAEDGLAVVDWLVEQPWSDGRVAVWGEQEDALLAEPLLASRHPAIRAGILRFADWDLLEHRLAPGGVPLGPVVERRARRAAAMDAGDPCGFSPRDCDEVAPLFLGPRATDEDSDGALRDEAIAQHEPAPYARVAEALDGGWPTAGGTEPDGIGVLLDRSPSRLSAGLGEAGVPTQLWAGWWEGATAAAALSRASEVEAPRMLIVGAFGPAGASMAAPGIHDTVAPMPDPREQFGQMAAFVTRHVERTTPDLGGSGSLGSREADPSDIASRTPRPVPYPELDPAQRDWSRVGRYAVEVFGAGWIVGEGPWPPSAVRRHTLVLEETGGMLPRASSEVGPSSALGGAALRAEALGHRLVEHEVDLGVGTGAFGRYLGRLETQLAWADRASLASRLLTFDGPVLAAGTTILGAPLLRLDLAFSTAPQGQAAALHAYLEAQRPNGVVELVSEGHLLLEGGELARREVEMQPLAIRVPAGSRMRLSLAGADADAFSRLPAQGTVRWRLAPRASTLDLPIWGAPGWRTTRGDDD